MTPRLLPCSGALAPHRLADTAPEVDALATRLRRRARGQVIFTEGDPGTNLCVVEAGRLRGSIAVEPATSCSRAGIDAEAVLR